MTISTTAAYTATLNTNCGAVTLKLDAANAPHTVNSFVFLAGQHYFDHVSCHRLTSGGLNVLQCGDPTGTGSGSPGYTFKDENLTAPSIKGGTYPAGTVAMANSGPNTNGSQFFLVYKDSQLPASYTPFGTITGGMDVLTKIAAAGSDNSSGTGDGHPLQTVVMNTVAVKKG
jgi:peptidyl-prolyl cis-trans isomerase B (cyclophilin B)